MSEKILADGTYVLDEPVTLPDVLDVLIVGGGPAGTAAAFHAKELGLAALVIDYDDLMKRIRDYAKDKLILPHFGGGDQMKFPVGGDLVARLHFGPIDKDEMCALWRNHYRRACAPARIGVELTSLEQQDDGLWLVKAWNHRERREQTMLARHVVIGIGRGVPRRFDIPGNTDGIAYRLDDAAKYVGAPALVIGGGTSAGEAVIAISNAKIAADDGYKVYWSYRGDKMPKVSKALSEVFFDAYLGNGNIQYFPHSEPAAVVTGPDRKEYLSLRVDRKELPGRPCETQHLEFEKTSCVACIGEDIPEAFLNSLGIYMATGGPDNKKRMVVTPLLETQQPNVYLIGDILSQAYFETDDFDADPASFREIKHRGNIKAALRDGVFVAEVIRQKLDGKQQIQVTLAFAEEEAAQEDALPPEVAHKTDSFLKVLVDREGPPAESVPDERAVRRERAFLVRVTPGGIDEDEFALKADGITTIGHEGCTLNFPDDTALSANHASISHGPEGYFLRDDGSETGTFLRLTAGKPVLLAPGDLLRMGRQILVFQAQNGGLFCLHYDFAGKPVARHTLTEGTIVLGRQAPDVTLDAQDKILSRRHLSLSVKDGKVFAKDLKSLNGSYLRVRDARKIEHGDVFRVGQQIFRLNLQEREITPSDSTVFRLRPYTGGKPSGVRVETPSAPEPAPPPAPTPAAPAASPAATFKGLGKTIDVKQGQTLCEAAEQQGIKIDAECHAGICGSDPVRILSGAEYLSALGDEEAGTLEDICGLKPGECRLACMVRLKGPVEVEIVKS